MHELIYIQFIQHETVKSKAVAVKLASSILLTACKFKTLFLLDASVNTSTSTSTKEKRHVMNFKDKAKWFSFAMSFVWPKSYACAYAYVDAYVAHFAASFCFTFCLDICAYPFV